MRLPAKNFFQNRFVLLLAAVSTLLIAVPEIVDARGARASGGFSRSSPAKSGSMSSHSGSELRADAKRNVAASRVHEPRAERDLDQARVARNTNDLDGARSTSSARSTQSSASVEQQLPPVREAKPVSAKEMAAYREEFKKQNKDWDENRNNEQQSEPGKMQDADGGDWDDNWHGEVERPVAAAVVVGAAKSVRTDAYLDYVREDDEDNLAYYSELPCSLQGVTAVNDVTYYACEKAWYVRGYESGSVVYIKTNPPPGQ